MDRELLKGLGLIVLKVMIMLAIGIAVISISSPFLNLDSWSKVDGGVYSIGVGVIIIVLVEAVFYKLGIEI